MEIITQECFKFYHATHIPIISPPNASITALINAHSHTFHLHMYALAGELNYPELETAAWKRLVADLMRQHKKTPELLHELVLWTFLPDYANEAGRGSINTSPPPKLPANSSTLRSLVVASVLVNEARDWSRASMDHFQHLCRGEAYAEFRHVLEKARAENQDILGSAATAGGEAGWMSRRRGGGIGGQPGARPARSGKWEKKTQLGASAEAAAALKELMEGWGGKGEAEEEEEGGEAEMEIDTDGEEDGDVYEGAVSDAEKKL